jgi:hypothetical protein
MKRNKNVEAPQTADVRPGAKLCAECMCSRAFRRQSSLKSHKCLLEREKPVKEEHAWCCSVCGMSEMVHECWFMIADGLAVHRPS